MRYLITGAQGFVGHALTARILDREKDAHIVGMGRSEERPAHFGERYRYRRLSLLETLKLRDLIDEVRPDCVFHLASALHTARERDLVGTNIEGTASLLNALAASDALVVLGSSGSVYGNPA